MTADTDITDAVGLVIAAGALDHTVHSMVIPYPPWSKMRPRHRRNGATYSDPKDRDAEERTGWYLKRAFKEPMPGNVAMACIFYRPNYQRIDADNLLKHVCDAATGIVWADDCQVTAILGVVRLDPERPRTVVAIAEHVSSLGRGVNATTPCAMCGGPIFRGGVTKVPKHCSAECSARSRGFELLTEPVPCAHCGEPFKRFTKTTKFCSPDCRAASLRGKPRGTKGMSSCMECGKGLAHGRGGRCRDCWRIHMRTSSSAGSVTP